jgi:hypothetical protein
MALVTATRYNTLRQSVTNVLETGSGDTGYGQTAGSSNINTGDLITAAQINNIYEDIRKCFHHQNGSDPASNELQQVSAGDLVKDNDGVNYSGWDQYEALALNISTNRLTAHTSSIVTGAPVVQRTRGSWNGDITLVLDVTFASADERRYFFNQGGFIRLYSTVTGGSSKDSDWQTLLNGAGNVDFKAHGTTASGGNGTASGSLGSYELTTSYQYIYQRFDGGTGAYSANDYYIEAQAPNDTTIKFRLVWRDQAGGNIDESVSNLDYDAFAGTATGNITGTPPGIVEGSGTNF